MHVSYDLLFSIREKAAALKQSVRDSTISRKADLKGDEHDARPVYGTRASQDNLRRNLEVGAGTRTGACSHCSSFYPTRTPSPCARLPARGGEFHRTQKWLAIS